MLMRRNIWGRRRLTSNGRTRRWDVNTIMLPTSSRYKSSNVYYFHAYNDPRFYLRGCSRRIIPVYHKDIADIVKISQADHKITTSTIWQPSGPKVCMTHKVKPLPPTPAHYRLKSKDKGAQLRRSGLIGITNKRNHSSPKPSRLFLCKTVER